MALFKKLSNLSTSNNFYGDNTFGKDQITPIEKGYSPHFQPCETDREKGSNGESNF